MRILLLSDVAPDRPDQGDKIRLLHLTRRLAQKHRLTLVSFAGGDEPAGEEGVADTIFQERITMPPLSSFEKVFRTMLNPHLPAAVALRRTGRVRRLLGELLAGGDYDLVLAYQLKMGANILGFEGITRVVDLTDALSLYYGRMTGYLPAPLKAFYRLERFKTARFERRVLAGVDLCLLASETDAAYMRQFAPQARVAVVPNGVDTSFFIPQEGPEDECKLLFTGNMAYPPNEDGALFFYREVFPLVLRQCPEARLVIAGKNPPPPIRALAGDGRVEVTGYVPDLRPYLAGAAVVVSPVRFGAGTRLKLLEAFAAGKAVVSSTLGCEGLDVAPGRHLEVADEPAEMAAKAAALLREPGRAAELGRRARELVEEKYDWRVIGEQLERLLQSALGKGEYSATF
ncbi:MAG: glycosyltransferase [Peptococcaceae bacterium]|nr:MAG: glycosyltransferase [Peptococcaceae bacterium]